MAGSSNPFNKKKKEDSVLRPITPNTNPNNLPSESGSSNDSDITDTMQEAVHRHEANTVNDRATDIMLGLASPKLSRGYEKIPENETPKQQRDRLNRVMKANKADELNIPIRIEGEITEKVMLDFTNKIFENQANETKQLAQKSYREDPQAWLNSASNRARLVIVETTNLDASELAKMVILSSPLERVLAVGLEGDKKTQFEIDVKKIWTEKLSDATEAYKNKFKEHFKANNNETLDSLVNRLSLEDLMGPHIYKEDLDISKKSINQVADHFDTNVEEILCFGESESMAKQLPTLAKEANDMPFLPISTGSADGHWRYSCKNAYELLNKLTNGLSAKELLAGENVVISKDFEKTFQLDQHKNNNQTDEEILSAEDQQPYKLSQKDLDYLKGLLTDEALYDANISPKAITKTISKATSWLGAKGGVAVGKALKWNIVNRPKSTIEGVHFAVASMVLDGGNDLVKEALDKKIGYKKYYDRVLEQAIAGGATPEQANQIAAQELVKAYCLEKKNQEINKMIEGKEGAQDWRKFGIQYANFVKKHNNKGLKYLMANPIIFGVSGISTVAGIALAVPTLGTSVPIGVGIGMAAGGGAMFGTSGGLMMKSVQNQYKANVIDLSAANYGFKLANSVQFDAQSKRNTLLNKELDESIATVKETYQQRIDQSPKQTVEISLEKFNTLENDLKQSKERENHYKKRSRYYKKKSKSNPPTLVALTSQKDGSNPLNRMGTSTASPSEGNSKKHTSNEKTNPRRERKHTF